MIWKTAWQIACLAAAFSNPVLGQSPSKRSLVRLALEPAQAGGRAVGMKATASEMACGVVSCVNTNVNTSVITEASLAATHSIPCVAAP